MEEDDLNAIIDVHLKGTFFVCQPAFIQMKEQGYGRFVNVSSPSGLFGNFGQLNYGAAKMGIVGQHVLSTMASQRCAKWYTPSACSEKWLRYSADRCVYTRVIDFKLRSFAVEPWNGSSAQGTASESKHNLGRNSL